MSDPNLQSTRPAASHLVMLGVTALAIVGAVVAIVVRHSDVPPPVAAVSAVVAPPSAIAPPTTAVVPPTKPSFDIARVTPEGHAVIAGRAAPDAEVSIQQDGKEIGHARADQQGAWVFVPTEKLAPGPQQLTLSERDTTGRETKGDGSVLLVVPPTPGSKAAAAQPTAPVAVLSTPNAAPVVLQPPPGAGASGAGAHLALDALEYDDHGQIRFAGTAPPGSDVRLYVDNAPVGDATAGANGRWALTPQASVAPGPHELRLDQLNARGKVVTRVALPFHREQMAASDIAEGRLVVQPGHSLWRLARRAYGAGVRYTVIFQANIDQIRDPNRIYPGQALTIPSLADAPAAAGAVTPASSSKSK